MVQVRKLQGSEAPPDASLIPDKKFLASHLREFTKLINAELRRVAVPIRFECEHLLTQDAFDELITGNDGHLIMDFLRRKATGKKISGVMHDTQIKTVVDIIKKVYLERGKSVLCLGAMMCGKTGTANGTHFMGPIFYLLFGIKYYPVQLLPVRRASARQTHLELQMHHALYQRLRIVCTDTGEVTSLQHYKADARALRDFVAPNGTTTLQRYNNLVLRGKLNDHVLPITRRAPEGDIFKWLMHRRSRASISPVQSLCLAAKKDGFTVLMIIDEPHWGSHKNGVQAQMLSELASEMQDVSKDHILVAFDATPFQIANAGNFSVVRHHLGKDYCGPNCWDGELLDPTVKTKDIKLLTIDGLAKQVAVPDFSMISRKAFASPNAYGKWLIAWNKAEAAACMQDSKRFVPLKCTYTQYKARMVVALKQTVETLLLRPKDGRTRGVCLRLFKGNKPSLDFIKDMNLDPKINVIPYMANAGQDSVVDAIEYADRLHLEAHPGTKPPPYLIVVTGAARMADLFPQDCTYFIDLTDRISNQPALMQGSYGRACGYGEPRTVVMHEVNIHYIKNYVETLGDFKMAIGKTVSMPTASGRQGAPLMNVRLDRHLIMTDKVLGRAFNQVQKIIDRLPPPTGELDETVKPQRNAIDELYEDGYVPFWSIFNNTVLEHLEAQRIKLLPECAEDPLILRPGAKQITKRGDTIVVDMHPDRPLSDGYGKVGLRNIGAFMNKAYTSENQKAKGKFNINVNIGTDNSGRRGISQPQLWLIPDPSGKWRLDVVVLRLARGIKSKSVAGDTGLIYASQDDMYYPYHTQEQRDEIDRRKREEAAKLAVRRQRAKDRADGIL